jgi:hypothetical protein
MIQLMDDFYLKSKIIGCCFAFCCVHRTLPLTGRLDATLPHSWPRSKWTSRQVALVNFGLVKTASHNLFELESAQRIFGISELLSNLQAACQREEIALRPAA